MPQAIPQSVVKDGNLVLDLGNNRTQDSAAPANVPPSDTPQGGNGAARVETIAVPVSSGGSAGREEITIVSPPPPQPQAVPIQTTPRPALQPRPAARPAEPATSQPVQPARPAAPSDRPNWMVQVGAYSTRAAAETVVRQITQTGHTASVVSGRTLHRVLVQAGPTRQDALDLATRLGQAGFPGAFVVPPRS